MRFLVDQQGDESVPARPTPAQVAAMRRVAEDAVKAGVLVFDGGIHRGGWGLLETRDRDEAVEWAKRFLDAAGGGEMRIRPVP